MIETNAIPTTADGTPAPRQGDLIDLLIVLAQYRKLLILAPLTAAVIAGAGSMALPNIYTANTRLLPPQQSQSSAAALLSQLGGMAGSLAGVASIKNPGDVYVGMLKSRTIAQKLIQRYDLKAVYETDTLEETMQKLEKNTRIAAAKDGLISIEVQDKDKQRVTQLTNSYVEELLKLTKVLAVGEAAQRRLFFEQQLELAKDNLVKAEAKFNATVNTGGVISVDADSRAIVETVGRMRAQISAKEIQLNSMRAFVTPNNSDYKRALEELSSLRGELSKLQNGRPAASTDNGQAGQKSAGLENMQILRDVKYYQMLYEMLAKQYELARLDEATDSSIIQVLDPALVPEQKSKPSRALIVLGAAFLGSFSALAWAFISEGKRKALLVPERAARWAQLRSYFR